MKKNILPISLLVFFLCGKNIVEIAAQNSILANSQAKKTRLNATLYGKVVDINSGKPIVGAKVSIYKFGTFKYCISTDQTGVFIVNMEAGRFDLEVSYSEYEKHKIIGGNIHKGITTPLKIQLAKTPNEQLIAKQVIPKNQTKRSFGELRLEEQKIEKKPFQSVQQIVSTIAGVSFSQ